MTRKRFILRLVIVICLCGKKMYLHDASCYILCSSWICQNTLQANESQPLQFFETWIIGRGYRMRYLSYLMTQRKRHKVHPNVMFRIFSL